MTDHETDPTGWTQRLQAAIRNGFAGDLLTLADEAPTRELALRAHRDAGICLLGLQQNALALEQFELALQIDPDDIDSRRGRTACQSATSGGEPAGNPRQVLLFSGHRVDSPGRPRPRFTPQMLPAAKRRLDAELDRLDAGAIDLALCQAAAGGDLLFLEACRSRGVHCQVLLPFDETGFIEQSILASINGAAWLQRWRLLKQELPDPPRQMAAELGPTPAGSDPYERCNRWLLHTALAQGPRKLRFICLWNGEQGDGPGGAQHLMDEVRSRHGHITWIDTRTLL